MLLLRDFKKSYNENLILSIPHLALPSGIHWIKGENGMGKSTLFKCIAGLIPFEGEILVNEVSQLSHPVPYRKQINFAEAEPLYPGFLTAKDLVRFIAKTRNASLDQQQTLCTAFGIDAFFEKPCETYSSGMVKKLSLALAFFGTPSLIILDEPIITLDQASRQILYAIIHEHQSRGVSFLMSSHQAFENSSLTITSSFHIKNKTLIRD